MGAAFAESPALMKEMRLLPTHTTKEIAEFFHIHPNTVRYYEKMGFLTPPERRSNGYRIFTARHTRQIHIIRLIYGGQWPGKTIRDASEKILINLPEWNLPQLKLLTDGYISIIESEIEKVERALDKTGAERSNPPHEKERMSYVKTAEKLGITKDTLRNWERNGFFSSIRNTGNRKFINESIYHKLEKVYALRLAGFSMSFIYQYLNHQELHLIEIHSAGDHLITFLLEIRRQAQRIDLFLTNEPSNGTPQKSRRSY